MALLFSVSPDDERSATGAQSIGRAAALLRLVGDGAGRGASLAEIVDASGLMKPTCRRILLALMEAGLVEQDTESRRYFLGAETYVLGAIAAERFGLQRLALEGVTRLARDTGDAAFVQVRRGFSVVCLHREDGDYPIRSHVLVAGDRNPLGAGAGPLAILAAMDDGDVETAISANDRLISRRYPMLTEALMRDLLTETRTLGYSINRGILFPGSWGMGMVVRDERGRPEACLSLAAIESRMQPDRQPELARLLRDEVQKLEKKLKEFSLSKQITAERGASAPAFRRIVNG